VEDKTDKAPPRLPLKPVLLALLILLAAGGAGFGLGYLARPDDRGPELTAGQARIQAEARTRVAVGRRMARRGFDAGRRSGRSHGIIAGGMAAESAVSIQVRQDRAAAALSDAAAAQSELAGMTAAPAPPVPEDEGGN